MSYEIKTDGKFRYLEEGEGDVVVILHGLFGALSNFQDLFEHFKGNYKVVIPMLPLYELPVINTFSIFIKMPIISELYSILNLKLNIIIQNLCYYN